MCMRDYAHVISVTATVTQSRRSSTAISGRSSDDPGGRARSARSIWCIGHHDLSARKLHRRRGAGLAGRLGIWRLRHLRCSISPAWRRHGRVLQRGRRCGSWRPAITARRPISDDAIRRKPFAAMRCAAALARRPCGPWCPNSISTPPPGADYVAYTQENLDALDRALEAYRSRFGKA